MSQEEQNKKAIAANTNKITNIKALVIGNRASLYQSRSMIEENRLMILSNYASAFMGNRQLANHNTDEIADNRRAILDEYVAETQVEKNHIDATLNQSTLEFFAHRCELNTSMLDISEKMASINAQLIAVNQQIMQANEMVVDFNSEQIARNHDLLDGGSSPSQATVQSNQALIDGNTIAAEELSANASANAERILDVMQESIENTELLIENKAQINTRRDSIMVNRGRMLDNRSRIKT